MVLEMYSKLFKSLCCVYYQSMFEPPPLSKKKSLHLLEQSFVFVFLEHKMFFGHFTPTFFSFFVF